MSSNINPNIASFGGLIFSYEEKTVQIIDNKQYFDIYNNNIVLENNNNNLKPGDKIEQISIEHTIHFENNDGSPLKING